LAPWSAVVRDLEVVAAAGIPTGTLVAVSRDTVGVLEDSAVRSF